MIRLFAAVILPADVAVSLQARQTGLIGARWRPLEALHLTLRFFGEIPEDRADDLDGELAAARGAPFELTLAGVGTFGAGAELRAVWAGVEESAALARLAARCESAARRAGLEAERRAFRPHVTLAYLGGADPARVAAWVQEHNLLRSPPFTVRAFGLYSSWRGELAAHYRLERLYPLV